MVSQKTIIRSLYVMSIFSIVFTTVTQGVYSQDSSVPVILFLGDSLTAGYHIEKNQAYPALIEDQMKKAGFHGKIINGGVSGDTTAGGLRRLNWYLRQKIDILVIALGANDGLRGIDPISSKQNLQQIIDNAHKRNPEMKIILAGMKLPPNIGAEYTAKFEKIFPELADDNKLPLIPFLLENVGGIKSMNLPDGIHPNARGHKHLCDNVWKVLATVL